MKDADGNVVEYEDEEPESKPKVAKKKKKIVAKTVRPSATDVSEPLDLNKEPGLIDAE